MRGKINFMLHQEETFMACKRVFENGTREYFAPSPRLE